MLQIRRQGLGAGQLSDLDAYFEDKEISSAECTGEGTLRFTNEGWCCRLITQSTGNVPKYACRMLKDSTPSPTQPPPYVQPAYNPSSYGQQSYNQPYNPYGQQQPYNQQQYKPGTPSVAVQNASLFPTMPTSISPTMIAIGVGLAALLFVASRK